MTLRETIFNRTQTDVPGTVGKDSGRTGRVEPDGRLFQRSDGITSIYNEPGQVYCL